MRLVKICYNFQKRLSILMIKKSLLFIVILLIGIQFIPLDRTNPPIDEKIALHTDPKVMQILHKSCYDCHSNETKWSKYAYIAPLSFGVVSHVEEGRAALNFSRYKTISKEIKILRLQKAIRTLKLNTMPLPSYILFHEDAKLSPNDKKILTQWFQTELKRVQSKQ